MPSAREATRIAKNLVSVAATGCILSRDVVEALRQQHKKPRQRQTGRLCHVLCRRRPNVRCLLSSRRHAEVKSAVGTTAMRELPRTNLGGERVVCRTG